MCSKEVIFKDSGPRHITAPNWYDANDRRSVIASLVNGVKVLECDRQQKNKRNRAEPWWRSFHFELRARLEDRTNPQNPIIFGAIFEFMPQNPPNGAPKFVIAFRGTLLSKATFVRDLVQDCGIVINEDLPQSPGFRPILRCAKELVATMGVGNHRKVWLAGHSLGAALALLVGKEMTREGYPLETCLFNPPFFTLSLEWMKISNELKQVNYLVRAVGRGLLSHLKSELGGNSSSNEIQNDPFYALKEWEPHLFLNSNDLICSGYIEYFEARKMTKRIKILRDLEKRATRDTVIRGLFSDKEQEPIHLLASAELNINRRQYPKFEAHEIQQWWNPEIRLESKLYQY